jgi:hypothetical protein
MSKIVKNILKISLASLAILFADQSQAMEQEYDGKYWYATFCDQISLEELVENHGVSPEVAALITNLFNKDTLKKNLDNGTLKKVAKNIYESSALSEHIIKKHGAARLIGALAIQQCADEYHCDAIKIPLKKAYIDEQGNDYAVEPKIIVANAPFSLQQIQQLVIIIQKTGYFDIHDKNIVNTAQGIAYFIDTEPGAFDFGKVAFPPEPAYLLLLLKRLTYLPMESDAKEWLIKRIEDKEKSVPKVIHFGNITFCG